MDVIEIGRIRLVRDSLPRFARRICTERELTAIGPDPLAQSLAGRFAAKEAVAKALGRSFRWHDVEILPDAMGKPMVALSGPAREMTGGGEVLVSITHTRTVAAATALWVEE
jgi:holo-[acyl-carrier protein] synthase